MKRLYYLTVLLSVFVVSCTAKKGSVVVFYSQTGNTEAVAMQLANRLGTDTLRILPLTDYSSDFQATVDRCKSEMADSTYPEIYKMSRDLAIYDTIYLGYPIWFGTFARPVVSFIRQNSLLAGHKVVPFATSGRGGIDESVEDLVGLCPDAEILSGFCLSSSMMENSSEIIDQFLNPENLCGGYTMQRPLNKDDADVFSVAVEGRSDMQFVPQSVSTQVVAGVNYKFFCKDSLNRKVVVTIFSPLPGQGDPQVTSVEQ